MKYIVWDLITPYDGYDQVECHTWDEVCAVMRERTKSYEYDKWVAGKIQKVETKTKQIFVTTEPITQPIDEK